MSQTISTLAVDVVAKTGGLTDGLELTKREIREAQKVIDSLRSPSQVMADKESHLRRLARGGALDESQLAQAIAKQRTEMLSSVPVLGQYAGLLNPITVATTVATAGLAAMSAGVAGLGAVVASRIEDIDRLGDSAARLGVSASSLSRLEVAATLGDVDPATVESAMTKMLTAVGKGDDAFAKIGLDVEKLKGLQADQLFGTIANEIEKMPTLADRMGFLGDIGIRDKEILGLLSRFDELNAAAERSGAVVGDELASRVAATDDSMKQLKATLTGLANDLTYVAAPAVKVVADAMTELLSNADQTKNAMGNIGLVFGGAGGEGVGRQLADMMEFNREVMRQEQVNRQPIRADGNRPELDAELETRKAILDAEVDAASTERKRFDTALSAIESLREQRQLMGATAEEAARLKAEKLKMTEAETAELLIQTKLLELEKQRRDTARDHTKQAIKDIESGERVVASVRTPAEATKDRLLSDLDALRKSGLDSPETRDRLLRRAAGELTRQEQGGFGAPGADKGTRAAREATIGAQHQAEQTSLLRRMVAELEKLVTKDEIEVTEITAS